MRFVLFSFLFLCILNQISAQVNTEKYRAAGAEDGYSGLIELDFDIETGNVEFQEINYELAVSLKEENYYSFLVGQGDFKWQSGRQFSNEALWHLRYVKALGGRYEAELFLQYNRNLARLLNFRGLIGGGVRYSIYSEGMKQLWFGAAYMFEKEIFEIKTEERYEIIKYSHRASFHLSFNYPLAETVTFNSVVYYQPRINEWKDFNILNENRLTFGIWKVVYFSASVKLRYDSTPPRKDIKNLDTKTLMGIIFKF